VKTYIEEFLTTFSGFHQRVFSFLTAYSLQQLFPQLTAHSNFFHSHSPTKQTLSLCALGPKQQCTPVISRLSLSHGSHSPALSLSLRWPAFWHYQLGPALSEHSSSPKRNPLSSPRRVATYEDRAWRSAFVGN
jgi:hypothetical protein